MKYDWENNKSRRSDRGGLIEHFCEHGVGHPNPGSALWIAESYAAEDDVYSEWGTQLSHGCDGCCAAEDFPNLYDSLRVAHAIIRGQHETIQRLKSEEIE